MRRRDFNPDAPLLVGLLLPLCQRYGYHDAVYLQLQRQRQRNAPQRVRSYRNSHIHIERPCAAEHAGSVGNWRGWCRRGFDGVVEQLGEVETRLGIGDWDKRAKIKKGELGEG